VSTTRQVLGSLDYQDFTIADTVRLLFVAALGCSDLRQKVASSSETQGCFADLL
jgi:hypothetical protein